MQLLEGTFAEVLNADLEEVQDIIDNGFNVSSVEQKLHETLEAAVNEVAGAELGVSLLDFPAVFGAPQNGIWTQRFPYSDKRMAELKK